jgi:3-phytase
MALDIVLMNDDGFDAPGIQALYSALVAAGNDVHIVAPKTSESAQERSLGGTAALDNPVTITEFSPGNYNVDGRPDVATRAAIDTLLAGNPPDLIISGTNKGHNTGESATLAAAAEAVFNYGNPSISLNVGTDTSGMFPSSSTMPRARCPCRN